MDKRERLLRQRARQFEQSDGTHKGWHSNAYHRHFEGYSEYMTQDEKGKVKIQRIYTAPWYHMALDSKVKRQLWIQLSDCWAVCMLLFLFAGTRNISVNSVWYMALCQAAAIVCSLWNASGIVHLIVLPEKAEVSQYRSSFEATRKSSMRMMTAFTGAGLSVLLLLILGCENFGMHLGCLAVYALCILLSLTINRLNENIPFTQEENDACVRENAAIID